MNEIKGIKRKLGLNVVQKLDRTLLVRKLADGEIIKARIVETECYAGGDDKASQSYNGRRTPRNEPMYMEPGTAYVYITYGMYFCFNISSMEPGGAVLIRAAEPVQGIDRIKKLRLENKRGKSKPLKIEETCNGPSKLCMSLSIHKDTCNKVDMCTSEEFWVEKDEESDTRKNIITTKRIGIESAGEIWANKPLRFYILGNSNVSKRDVKAEKEYENKSVYF